MLTLRPEDLPKVRGALARYRKARAELDKLALHGIKVLRGRIEHEKTARRRSG